MKLALGRQLQIIGSKTQAPRIRLRHKNSEGYPSCHGTRWPLMRLHDRRHFRYVPAMTRIISLKALKHTPTASRPASQREYRVFRYQHMKDVLLSHLPPRNLRAPHLRLKIISRKKQIRRGFPMYRSHVQVHKTQAYPVADLSWNGFKHDFLIKLGRRTERRYQGPWRKERYYIKADGHAWSTLGGFPRLLKYHLF